MTLPYNPTNLTGDIPEQFAEDLSAAQRRGVSVAEVQEERKLKATAAKVLPRALSDIEKREAKLALEQEKLEAERAELNRAAHTWQTMLATRAKLQQSKATGEFLLSSAEQLVADLKQAINLCLNREHHLANFHDYPAGILALGAELVGAERVAAMGPAWRKEIADRISKHEAAMAEFAKVNKLATEAE